MGFRQCCLVSSRSKQNLRSGVLRLLLMKMKNEKTDVESSLEEDALCLSRCKAMIDDSLVE